MSRYSFSTSTSSVGMSFRFVKNRAKIRYSTKTTKFLPPPTADFQELSTFFKICPVDKQKKRPFPPQKKMEKA